MFEAIFNASTRSAKSAFKKGAGAIMKKEMTTIIRAIISGAPVTNKTGTRIWPNPTRDAEVGVRLDWGSKSSDAEGRTWQALDLQVNKNANNATLAELAAGSRSHAKRVTMKVQVDESGRPVATESELREAFEDQFVDVAMKDGF